MRTFWSTVPVCNVEVKPGRSEVSPLRRSNSCRVAVEANTLPYATENSGVDEQTELEQVAGTSSFLRVE